MECFVRVARFAVGSTVQYAWKKAAECAARADATSDADVRVFFMRLRDSWIAIANRHELLESMHDPAARREPPIAADAKSAANDGAGEGVSC
jgi:hypothetical protein